MEIRRILKPKLSSGLTFTGGSKASADLRAEIDEIKGPLKIHGLSFYGESGERAPGNGGREVGAKEGNTANHGPTNGQKRVEVDKQVTVSPSSSGSFFRGCPYCRPLT